MKIEDAKLNKDAQQVFDFMKRGLDALEAIKDCIYNPNRDKNDAFLINRIELIIDVLETEDEE